MLNFDELSICFLLQHGKHYGLRRGGGEGHLTWPSIVNYSNENNVLFRF